jgi:hypothetical protein
MLLSFQEICCCHTYCDAPIVTAHLHTKNMAENADTMSKQALQDRAAAVRQFKFTIHLRQLWSTLSVFRNRSISREWNRPVTLKLSSSFPGERGYCSYDQIWRKVHIDECTYQHCLYFELELLLSIISNKCKHMSLFHRYSALKERTFW